MNIFLCYPSAERATADQINLALLAQWHDVFFDRDDFSEGDEYHHRISRVIEPSDVFIFLVTPGSLAKRRYTLMELDIAQAKWERPSGHVLPVVVQPTPIKEAPPYLHVVMIFDPKGEMLAYRGWADFLRLRDGRNDLKPEVYYQRAIEVDPSNAYAHALWGHWILWTGGNLADANRHFTPVLTVAEHRLFVHALQLAALGNRSNDEFDIGQILVANEM